jgi:hypothetical protein
LKAHEANRLTLKCDKVLSSFAVNFNLRRYSMGSTKQLWWGGMIEVRVENAWVLCLKLKHHKLLSKFAFNFSSRLCMMGRGGYMEKDLALKNISMVQAGGASE